jgi:hypothetical protein
VYGTAPALRIYHSVDSVNSVDFLTTPSGFWGGRGGGAPAAAFFWVVEKRGDAAATEIASWVLEADQLPAFPPRSWGRFWGGARGAAKKRGARKKKNARHDLI